MALILSSRHSSCAQFSASLRNVCRRVMRRRVSSALGTKAETTSRTHFKLRALSFHFFSKLIRTTLPSSSLSTTTCQSKSGPQRPPSGMHPSAAWFPVPLFRPWANEKGADRMIGSRGFKRQNVSLAKLPLRRRVADMPGGASARSRPPTAHRLCARGPTRRFRAAALTCGGTCLRASRVTRRGFPAPPRGRLRARRSCRHCRPCASDAR